jgi:hypothetical protein
LRPVFSNAFENYSYSVSTGVRDRGYDCHSVINDTELTSNMTHECH